MSDVNVQLVREFFELNAFHVMTYWPHDTLRPRAVEHGMQLFAENTAPEMQRPVDLVLEIGDMPAIRRAVVGVRAWHADRFYPSVIEANPVLQQIVEHETRERAHQIFGGADWESILVISELPASPEPRQRAIERFREIGIGHILEFPTIIQEILHKINAHVSYSTSQTLQTLRLLKRYDFIRNQQLEFPFPTEAPIVSPRTAAANPVLDSVETVQEDDEDLDSENGLAPLI